MNRLSTADVNPYAAPQVPDAMLVEPECVGAWRDGNRLVVHRHLTALPRICLLTGQPAGQRRSVDVSWSYPIDIWTRMLRLQVSVCDSALASNRRWKWLIAGMALGVFALLIGVFSAPHLLPFELGYLIGPLGVVLLFTSAQVLGRFPALRFKRVRGDYLWLAGAGPKFLDQLPSWPGTS